MSIKAAMRNYQLEIRTLVNQQLELNDDTREMAKLMREADSQPTMATYTATVFRELMQKFDQGPLLLHGNGP